MTRFGPKSIRGKMTLLAGVATAVAMALIVVVMGVSMRVMLENAIAESLMDRVEQARSAVEQGDYARAVDASGNEILQVVDSAGNVIAESRNAQGLEAIEAALGRTDWTELMLDRMSEEAEQSSPGENEAADDTAGRADDSVGESYLPSNEQVDYEGSHAYSDADDADDARDDTFDDDGAIEEDIDSDDADDSTDSDNRNERGDDPDSANGEGDFDVDEDNDDANDLEEEIKSAAIEDADEDNDDEGPDDDDGERSAAKGVKTQALPPYRASFNAGPWSLGRAWAAEERITDFVDAASVMGVEGPYIVLREDVMSPDGPLSIIAVASLASAARSAWQMAELLAVIMAVVLVAVVAFTWVLTGRTLRPVEDMRAKAASITAENLNERIEVPRSDKDLARLAETLNEMLARIADALDEEKRFISDASHELKSPIAATSVILDSLRAHPEALDVEGAIDDLSDENARMASIVSDMLTLTRYDEGRLKCNPEPIDLMDVLVEEAMSLKARSNVTVDTTDVQPIVCRADDGLLRHAVRNLLDNAARYANCLVKLSCGQEGGGVFITVSDDGRGIPPADRTRVFGRFVCLDEGHSSKGNTGLGLAVVATAIAAHGGTVAFIDPELGGATARIDLPE